MSVVTVVNRRDFLKVTGVAGTGLLLGFYIPFGRSIEAALLPADAFKPNAWLQIDIDGTVTIWVHRSEMGQGVRTSLPMIVAEELDANWSKVRVSQAGADRRFGSQFTVGSRSVRSSWEPLRKAGAAAREMLIAAAAGSWGAPTGACRAEKGVVVHEPTGRRLPYGELAEAAASLPVPENPPLKDPKDFRIIGQRIPRTDTPLKVDGSAVFGMDVKLPAMLYATVARCPVFGGSLKTFNPKPAETVEGVRHVVGIDHGVAVVAENTWAAIKGLKALEVNWDEGPLADLSSAGVARMLEDGAKSDGVVKTNHGDAESALARSARVLEEVYEVPYLAHACMEPLNCTVHVRENGCEVWAPTQAPQRTRQTAAEITGLPLESVTVYTTFMGGGFGRRASQDFVREAVQVSKAVRAPVKLVWLREDDIRGHYYRPATYNLMRAGLDPDGRPLAWTHRLVAPEGPDWLIVGGANSLPYAILNVHMDYVTRDPGVRLDAWRSVGHSQSAFVTESFIDELAHAAGRDPYEYRRELLAESPRHLAVLDLAATEAGWGQPLPKGWGRGIAIEKLFNPGTYVAQVAEVSVDENDALRVQRVVCAVDCGTVVNPDIVDAQIQSGIVYGLTAALKGEITIENGRVQQGNFDDYQMLRMKEMPTIEVHIVQSREPPMGVGEAGTPPIAPAVANAVYAATGKRIRRLPIRQADLKEA